MSARGRKTSGLRGRGEVRRGRAGGGRAGGADDVSAAVGRLFSLSRSSASPASPASLASLSAGVLYHSPTLSNAARVP
jgi:hypothetical protein